uniref:Uncharacterized protein n=1 Tax=Rhipicephalus microplus TaxID=6941 RepID=A0A6G5A8Q7_RHIMP
MATVSAPVSAWAELALATEAASRQVLVQALEHSRRASREALLDTSKDPEPSQGVQLTGLLTPSATTRATTTRPASQLPIARPLEQANSRDLRVSREVPLDIRLDSGSRLTAILPVSATRVSALSAESSAVQASSPFVITPQCLAVLSLQEERFQ